MHTTHTLDDYAVYPKARLFLEKKGVDKHVLLKAIQAIHEYNSDIDFWNVHKTSTAIRFGQRNPELQKGKVLGGFKVENGEFIIRFPATKGRSEKQTVFLTDDIDKNRSLIFAELESQFVVEGVAQLTGGGRLPGNYTVDGIEPDDNEDEFEEDNEIEGREQVIPSSSLNQIFYGPPGTGKTYHTLQAAVKAAEPEFYASLNIDQDKPCSAEQRATLTAKYQSLVAQQRIRFVTFHQSYGYDEFVEGIRPVLGDNGSDVGYEVKPGVFKEICAAARDHEAREALGLANNARVWKFSIDGVGKSKVRDYCFKEGYAALGWEQTGDLAGVQSEQEATYFANLGKNNRDTLDNFFRHMQQGELVLCISSQRTIQAIGIVAGDYEYHQDGFLAERHFPHCRKINWLVTECNLDIYALNDNKNLVQKSVYPLNRISVNALLEEMSRQNITLKHKPSKPQNYVLIIDEINRGNISKIFGELITLIEPVKRHTRGGGNTEALEVILPYSQQAFSVPDNVYLIGTMNTADRSLALIDTALRRRFDFTEMMPQPSLLEGNVVKGVDLSRLLHTMNRRIEILYDREHTLGHAFFMPVVMAKEKSEAEAFSTLRKVFVNKVIPLLEEYFFEDWNKISLVLGCIKNSKFNFIKQESHSYNDIFGPGHGLDTFEDNKVVYILEPVSEAPSCIWNQPEAYQQVYAGSVSKNETND